MREGEREGIVERKAGEGVRREVCRNVKLQRGEAVRPEVRPNFTLQREEGVRGV